jgi:pilus assembly protein CpaE
MQSVLRMVLVDPCSMTREDLKRNLAGLDLVWVEAECAHYEEVTDVLNQTGVDIVVLGVDADPGRALEAVGEITRISPQTRVFVASNYNDSLQILQAMRAGAHEYLTTPIQMEDLLPALDRVRQMPGRTGSAVGTSKVIAVTGASGGVGTTCAAVNLGCALAASPERRVVFVDLDLVAGDADVCLDLVHSYTLTDVVDNISRLDFTLLKRSLVQHKTGMWFLPHPTSIADVARVQPENLKRLISLLKATFTHVVLDLSNGFRSTDVAAMEVADVVLLITQLDVSCIRNASRVLKALEGADELLKRFKIVMNRTGAKEMTIPLEKAEGTIGRETYWQLPNDWVNTVAARTAGVPLLVHAPKSKLAQAIIKLAEDLTADELATKNGKAADAPKRRGLFAMLTGSA